MLEVMYYKVAVRMCRNHRGKTKTTLATILRRGRFNDTRIKRTTELNYAQVMGCLHQVCKSFRHGCWLEGVLSPGKCIGGVFNSGIEYRRILLRDLMRHIGSGLPPLLFPQYVRNKSLASDHAL